jgi:hypothetical protein
MIFFHVGHCIVNALNWVPHLAHYHCLVFVDFQRIKGPRNFETSKGEFFLKPWQANNQQWNFFEVFSKLLLDLSSQKFNSNFFINLVLVMCLIECLTFCKLYVSKLHFFALFNIQNGTSWCATYHNYIITRFLISIKITKFHLTYLFCFMLCDFFV